MALYHILFLRMFEISSMCKHVLDTRKTFGVIAEGWQQTAVITLPEVSGVVFTRFAPGGAPQLMH